MKTKIELKDVMDDLELFINEYKPLKERYCTLLELHIKFNSTCTFVANRTFRLALQQLILTDRISCLIASGKGYKFASNTKEMQIYLKSVHHRALEILRRMAALKRQAEHDLGLQLDMEFYNEIYQSLQ